MNSLSLGKYERVPIANKTDQRIFWKYLKDGNQIKAYVSIKTSIKFLGMKHIIKTEATQRYRHQFP
jgi:hypothetical protein